MSMELPSPRFGGRFEGLKSPLVRVIAIAGLIIILLAIALWSATKKQLGTSSALNPNTANGLNADASGPVPSVIIIPPSVLPRPRLPDTPAPSTDTPAPSPAPEPAPAPAPVTAAPPPPPPPPPPAPTVTPTPAPTPAPAPLRSYTVVSGDTLNAIASRFGVSTWSLGTLNQSTLDAWSGKTGTSRWGNYPASWDYIYPGEVLSIPS